MRLEDLPAVMEIEAKCFLNPWSLNALLAEFANPRALRLVARMAAEGTVVGFADVGGQGVQQVVQLVVGQ